MLPELCNNFVNHCLTLRVYATTNTIGVAPDVTPVYKLEDKDPPNLSNPCSHALCQNHVHGNWWQSFRLPLTYPIYVPYLCTCTPKISNVMWKCHGIIGKQQIDDINDNASCTKASCVHKLCIMKMYDYQLHLCLYFTDTKTETIILQVLCLFLSIQF